MILRPSEEGNIKRSTGAWGYTGFDFIGFEIDEDYYEAATKRLNAVIAQLTLF